MKTKLKKLSKRTISIVLTLVMLVSMAVVGMVTSQAYGINSGAKIYFLKPSSWTNVLLIYDNENNSNESWTIDLAKVTNSTNLYYVKINDNQEGSKQYAFADGSGWGYKAEAISSRKGTNSSQVFNSKWGDNLSDSYYCFSGSNGSFNKSDNSSRDTLMKIDVQSNVYTDGTLSNTGGNVNVAGYYFNNNSDTALATSTANGNSTTTTYAGVKGAPFTLTAVAKNGYRFEGWYSSTSSNSALSTDVTYTVSPTTATTYYARFVTDEDFHDVTFSASDGGTITPNGTQSVGEKTKQAVTATADAGYAFDNWEIGNGITLTEDTASGSDRTANVVTKATGTYTVKANFTEKATNTINVVVDEHAKVTVSGSSVAGQNQTFTTDGSFTAHVDDVIRFSGAGNPSSGYSIDTLTYSADGGTTTSTDTSFTVSSAGNYKITATSKVKSGYSFYVSAGTGANATVNVHGQSTMTVNAGNRQKIYVEDDTKTFTISAAAASNSYDTPTVTRITSAIDKAGTTVTSSDAQTKALADGATYYVTTSEKGTSSSAYVNLASYDRGQWNNLGQPNYKYISGVRHYYITIPKANFNGTNNLFVGIANQAYTNQNTDDVDFWNNGSGDSSSANVAPGSETYLQAGPQDFREEHFARVNFKNSSYVSQYDVIVDITQSGSNINYEFSIDSGSSGDITAFDTYYLGGRFRIKDSDSGQIVYTDTTEGSWQTYSVRMPFTKTSGTTYKLETNQTIAQLSAQLNGRPPYFVVHDKKDVFHTTGGEVGLNFENQIGSAKALTLNKSGSLTYQNEMLFSDDENNSDGKVTIYFDSSNKHIWYVVEDETADVGTVTLKAKYNNAAIAETTSGNEVTLEATIADKHANAGTMTYTFYNATTNEKIGEVTTSDTTASIPYTETHVRTDTFKVVVSSDGYDTSGTGNKLRNGIAKTNVKFKNKNLYRTTTNLNGDVAVLCNNTNWNSTAMTDGQEYTFDLTLSQHQTYEFALATALPTGDNDPEALQGNIPEDFYIDEALSKYCDIEYYTLTVNYQNGDDTEQYVVRTYKVTPRTNCANPTVHINTKAIAVKQPNGETQYYPGSIYAVATYTPGKTNTKAEEETVTYYFAEAVGDENQSLSGNGMAIAYWNNSLDNIRMNNEDKHTQVAEIKKLDTYTAVSTPVEVNGSNTIYVDMSKLYEAKESTASKQFKIYSVDLPVWATSFAFIKTATKGSDVIDTTSWNEGTAYGYSSLLLNPNRVYLLYKNSNYWYSKGVVLDKGLWDSAKKNDVDTKTFKSNVINYNTSYSGDSVTGNFNTNLSARAYGDYTNNQALYFGLFNYDEQHNVDPHLNDWRLVNNLAMRGQTASDYHASIQNLVAEKLDTDNVNSNGFPLLEAYTDTAKHNKANMPLFDYDMLANDKSSQSETLIKRQYLGVDFPMYESSFNGIKTYSYDSSTDPNRAIENNNFVIDSTWRKAAEYLGYAPFIKTDNDLYGNATELDVEFFMSNTGSLKGTDNQPHDITFNFSGDDDVWVYVDGVLVLDLGGAHMASAGSINFTDMKVYYKTAANDTVAAAEADNGNEAIKAAWAHDTNKVNTINLKALLEANGVNFNNKDGNTKHTFQMFYLERGAHDSNMSVSFNLPQASGLNIANEITANNVNAGLKDAAMFAANSDYFTYGVSAALNSGSLYTNTTAAYSGAGTNAPASGKITANSEPKYPLNTATNRVYSATVAKNGSPQTLTANYPLSRLGNSPQSGATYNQTDSFTSLNGVTYSLSDAYLQPENEGDTYLDVSGITDANGEFHLLGKQTATFDDKITPHSFVEVYQDEALGKVDTDQTPIGYSTVSANYTGNYYLTSYSIYDDHSSTWIKQKTSPVIVPHNAHLYAADNSANTNMFYFSDYAKQGPSAAMTVTFYNDIAVGDIRITKDYNNSSAGTTFYFDVEFANIFGSDDSNFSNYVAYNLLTYDVVDANGAIVSRGVPYGVAGIALKGGQTAIISGVPVETRYKVTERTKSGTSLNDINKYVEGPDGNDLHAPIPTHRYAEHFNSTDIKQSNISSTSDDYELFAGDKYYKNMIPIVQESDIGGNSYRSTSFVKFTNIKTSVKITFNYYDRKVINSTPAAIDSNETRYVVYNSLPDSISDATAANVKLGIKSMIADSAVEFTTQALTQNVVDTYKMWTSQSEAKEAIGNQINVRTLRPYSEEADYESAKSYHTNHVSQLITSSQTNLMKWVSYKAGSNFIEEEDIDTGEEALAITEINVWLFNTPRTYTLNIYGAKTLGELSDERTVMLNGKETTIRVANSSLAASGSKLTKNDLYYNQRLGDVLNEGGGIDTTSYISQYSRDSFRKDIEPVDYITRNTLVDNNKNYRFAYWAYDPAGQVVASRDAYFYYRITRDTDLYAVYSETQLTEQDDAGLSIYNNANDTYVDSNGKSKTRLNVVVNPYACKDKDERLKQTAMLYVNLSDVVQSWDNTDIIALFNQYRKQLDDILTTKAASTVSSTDLINFNPVVRLNAENATSVTLTTKGFVRNAFGNDVPNTITTTTPTAKNRVQYTMNIQTAALKKNTKLMFVGAMYYNSNYESGVNHWTISDNCLIYEDGVCKDLDFQLSNS